MEPIMRSYKEHALEIFKDKPKFLVSSLDDAAAAVLGASAIGWEL
jgi:glucokinase